MARKHRIETKQGIYHLLNRGNYKQDIFSDIGAKAAFLKTLYEAVELSRWELLAYAVMENHFHLLVHTPEGNLISGMKWLQSTFANRFNRFRKEHGRLFQGRYKSLIVEPGAAVVSVGDYIHLNPFRAGIVAADKLDEYPWTSLYYLRNKKARPEALHLKRFLEIDHGFKDVRSGHEAYLRLLQEKAGMNASEIHAWRCECSRGWCLGSKEFKRALMDDLKGRDPEIFFSGHELAEANQEHWALVLESCLKEIGLTPELLKSMKKSSPLKVEVAAYLKMKTSASNGWVAENLHMGHPSTMASLVSKFRKKNMGKRGKCEKLLKYSV